MAWSGPRLRGRGSPEGLGGEFSRTLAGCLGVSILFCMVMLSTLRMSSVEAAWILGPMLGIFVTPLVARLARRPVRWWMALACCWGGGIACATIAILRHGNDAGTFPDHLGWSLLVSVWTGAGIALMAHALRAQPRTA
jgi:hypothetical protein